MRDRVRLVRTLFFRGASRANFAPPSRRSPLEKVAAHITGTVAAGQAVSGGDVLVVVE